MEPVQQATQGVSPKVTIPVAILAGLGAVCLVASFLLDESTLAEVGLSLLGASGVVGGAGYAAKPGPVVPRPVKKPARVRRYRRKPTRRVR